ncbi:MAG TPA: hypothetical protein VI877_05775 [Dehalococcoidia bacterium]|nr:hypothetical protein [Dehalococcoidia bacterium]
METEDERLEYAVRHTQVLRPPRQNLETFGITKVRYHLLTAPAYTDLVAGEGETVVREGQVIAERPRVVTPYYLLNLQGFSHHARRYLEKMAQEEHSSPALLYRYRNEVEGLSIVSEPLDQLAQQLTEKLEREGTALACVIKGVDELWDVSLLRFIHEFTIRSLQSNVMDLGRRGLLEIDPAGVPLDARRRIEELFHRVREGRVGPSELKVELDCWGLWPEYEDRFLALFQKRP